jgi:hypothetical protein
MMISLGYTPMLFSMTLMLTMLSFANVASSERTEWFLPINVVNRQSLENVRLTSIGEFGRPRQARAAVPAHLHTAIDLMRPTDNYFDEPIFPAAVGTLISLRTDGPFAQIIIEHQESDGESVWTIYEHIAEARVGLGEIVNPERAIGRFFNKSELDKFGWQFDHLHFEILKQPPRRVQPDPQLPFRLYSTYTLECYDQNVLRKYYHDPRDFFESRWQVE